MSIITYLKDIPLMKKVFGILIIIAGLYIFITSNILFGLIFIVIGINLLLREGSQINLENKTYRTVKSIFGMHVGKWKPCPEFEYISVFRTKENQTVNVVTATTTFTNEVILLNLFYNRNKHLTFYKTDNKADAFKVAEHFKLALAIDILDATESETKWL
ncbi:hypothetical protein [Flavobacterium sp.]|jgi:hypothetical protein|uniref:hypothetical protein n=1 Tax=Flavobacterium sp. TaxID=239 RepID=UPI0037BF81A5